MSDSIVERLHSEGSIRSQKSKILVNGPPSVRAATIASAAPPPQPLMALSPK
jgi:hypothetical protein